MKDMTKKKKSVKPVVLPLLIVFFLLVIICPSIIFSFKHQPFLLHQTEVLFEDSNQNIYFSIVGIDSLKKYNYHKKNLYENYKYENGELTFNCEQAAANSKNIFLALEHFSKDTYGIIKVFDKSFDEITTLEFGSFLTVRGLACTENNLYYVLKNTKNNSHSLFKFNLETNDHIELMTGLVSTDLYQDEEVSLFFTDLFRVQKKQKKTILINKTNQEKNSSYFTDGNIKLEMNRNKITIQNKELLSFFDVPKGINSFYDKVVLVDDHLIFGLYQNTKNPKCGANNQNQCICGMKKSYLFDFDTINNELNMIQEFKDGTFLIDYDLNGVKYYYNGSLYNGSVLCVECENLSKYKNREEFVGIFGHWHEPIVDYYISFYDDCFYGI